MFHVEHNVNNLYFFHVNNYSLDVNNFMVCLLIILLFYKCAVSKKYILIKCTYNIFLCIIFYCKLKISFNIVFNKLIYISTYSLLLFLVNKLFVLFLLN